MHMIMRTHSRINVKMCTSISCIPVFPWCVEFLFHHVADLASCFSMTCKCYLLTCISPCMVASCNVIHHTNILLEYKLVPKTNSLFLQALMPIGALFGGPIGGLMADKTGRKSVLAASGIPNFFGWMVIVMSYYSRSASTFKLLILIGRFLTGFASGCLTSAVPVSSVYM